MYLVAARLSRYRTTRGDGACPASSGLIAVVVIRQSVPYLAEQPERADWLFVPVLAAYAGARVAGVGAAGPAAD